MIYLRSVNLKAYQKSTFCINCSITPKWLDLNIGYVTFFLKCQSVQGVLLKIRKYVKESFSNSVTNISKKTVELTAPIC